VEIGYTVVDSTNTKWWVETSWAYLKRDGKYICIRDMGSSIMPNPKNKKLAINSK
jgi:hypothetical protein